MDCFAPAENNRCENAQVVNFQDSTIGKLEFVDSKSDNRCHYGSRDRSDIWYQFAGDATMNYVYFMRPNDTYSFSMYVGDCDSLICISPRFYYSTDTLQRKKFYFEEGKKYFIEIHSDNRSWSQDEFSIYFEQLEIAQNDTCEGARTLRNGDVIEDSTYYAVGNESLCGTGDYRGLPAIWYKIVGDNTEYKLNTGNRHFRFTSHPVDRFILYEGNCDQLSCIQERAYFDQGEMRFFAEEGKDYYVSCQDIDQVNFSVNSLDQCWEYIEHSNRYLSNSTYKALEINSLATIRSESDVQYLAEEEVLLLPGFETEDDSDFIADIVECEVAENSEKEVIEERSIEENIIKKGVSLTTAPNPFTYFTNIQYQIPKRSEANLLLFTAQGKLARSILSVQTLEGGKYNATLDASDLEAGLYFLILQTETEKVVKKLVVVK